MLAVLSLLVRVVEFKIALPKTVIPGKRIFSKAEKVAPTTFPPYEVVLPLMVVETPVALAPKNWLPEMITP